MKLVFDASQIYFECATTVSQVPCKACLTHFLCVLIASPLLVHLYQGCISDSCLLHLKWISVASHANLNCISRTFLKQLTEFLITSNASQLHLFIKGIFGAPLAHLICISDDLKWISSAFPSTVHFWCLWRCFSIASLLHLECMSCACWILRISCASLVCLWCISNVSRWVSRTSSGNRQHISSESPKHFDPSLNLWIISGTFIINILRTIGRPSRIANCCMQQPTQILKEDKLDIANQSRQSFCVSSIHLEIKVHKPPPQKRKFWKQPMQKL